MLMLRINKFNTNLSYYINLSKSIFLEIFFIFALKLILRIKNE